MELAYIIVLGPAVIIGFILLSGAVKHAAAPTMERKAQVLGVNSELSVYRTSSSTSYLVSLRFDDGTVGDFGCSRSLHNRLNSGDKIMATIKGQWLLEAGFVEATVQTRNAQYSSPQSVNLEGERLERETRYKKGRTANIILLVFILAFAVFAIVAGVLNK